MLKRSRLTIRHIFLAVAMLLAAGAAFAAVPGVPTLSWPANGSTVNGTSVSFSWNSVANATYYQLQLSPDSGFNTLLVNKNEGTWTSDIYSPLSDNGTWYYWRVKACNGEAKIT